MAQYHNSRNYRRDEQRNVNEVVFRDGMPVTYSSRQERGGKRPEGGYNKGGKSVYRLKSGVRTQSNFDSLST